MMQKRPAPLGRGLAALLGDKPQPVVPQSGLRTVPIDRLEPGPFQPRANLVAETLAELADSIRSQGLLQPILVRPKPHAEGRFEIIGGERRWRAAQLVPLHDVPIIVRDFSDRDAMAAALVENLQREDLDALEEASGYRRLIDDFGLTQEALGSVVGKSRSHVANTLRLLGLPERLRTLLQAGKLTAGHARALLTAPHPEALAEQVVARGLNVRQTEALASAPVDERAKPAPSDPTVDALAKRLSQHLGLRVTIRSSGSKGQMSIQFDDLDQLDGLLRLLNGGGSPYEPG